MYLQGCLRRMWCGRVVHVWSGACVWGLCCHLLCCGSSWSGDGGRRGRGNSRDHLRGDLRYCGVIVSERGPEILRSNSIWEGTWGTAECSISPAFYHNRTHTCKPPAYQLEALKPLTSHTDHICTWWMTKASVSC